jgi:hypothetical protein
MACSGCQKQLGQMASRFIPCLRVALGLPAGGSSWGVAEHQALYDKLSTMTHIQAARGMSQAQITAIPFGSEPDMTAGYASAFPTTSITATSSFWSCLGIEPTAAAVSMGAESGAYYEVAMGAANAISRSEGGTVQAGIPWWVWVLGGGALLAGGIYLLSD